MRCKPSEKPKPKPKPKHKKGLWSPDEDQKLTHYVINYGHACWSSVPVNAGLQRNGKSCRLRWINYLRPGLKRGPFTSQEDETILSLHGSFGNKWSLISQHLPGRTDNEIKNYWHSHLKKRIAKSEHLQTQPKLDYKNSNSSLADQSVPSVSQFSNSSKILFAEWISLDEFQQEFSKLSEPVLNHGSDYQLTHVHSWSSNEGSTHQSNDNRNYLKEEMLHTHMTFDQIFNSIDEDLSIDDFIYM